MRNTIVAAVLVVAGTLARADTLLLDGLEASLASAGERPARGQSMERVEARFGAPSGRHGPVGDPPITSWEYPDFIVYFEHNLVIHAAARHEFTPVDSAR